MAETMAVKNGNRDVRRSNEAEGTDTSSPQQTGNERGASGKNSDSKNDPEFDALVDIALKAEMLKLERDPSQFLRSLVKMIGIIGSRDLKPMALTLVKEAKTSFTALKVLVELCRLVQHDSIESGPDAGLSVTDLIEAGFDPERVIHVKQLFDAGSAEPELQPEQKPEAVLVEAISN